MITFKSFSGKKTQKELFMYHIMLLYNKLNIQVMQRGLDINNAD